MRTYTCIICPNGCEITAEKNGDELSLSGALCKKGGEYVRQEMSDPRRTISSLAKVDGGDRPLVSVRITAAIPRDKIADLMAVVKELTLTAPVTAGQVLVSNPLGYEGDLIATDGVAVVSN